MKASLEMILFSFGLKKRRAFRVAWEAMLTALEFENIILIWKGMPVHSFSNPTFHIVECISFFFAH